MVNARSPMRPDSDRRNLADRYNNISDLVCGYREASEDEVEARVRQLVEIECRFRVSEQVDSFRQAVRDLADQLKDIEEGRNHG